MDSEETSQVQMVEGSDGRTRIILTRWVGTMAVSRHC